MNEPKKRGRPSKAEVEARLEGATVQVPVINGDHSREPEDLIPAKSAAQEYALRVWAGQSESADRPWRIQRVKEALEGQGLSMEGVELP